MILRSVAITWTRTVLFNDVKQKCGDNDVDEDDDDCDASTTKTTTTVLEEVDMIQDLGNEDTLFKWRLDIRNFDHNLLAWEEYATLHDTHVVVYMLYHIV